MSRNHRTAGHNYERFEADQLRKSGLFPNAVCSRAESKSRDDSGVDLMNREESTQGRMEYNFQCKNSSQMLNYHKIMEHIPNSPDIMNVILHKFTLKPKNGGTVFVTKGMYAILKRDDFYKLMEFRRAFETVKKASDACKDLNSTTDLHKLVDLIDTINL
jgi:hypothetical protein